MAKRRKPRPESKPKTRRKTKPPPKVPTIPEGTKPRWDKEKRQLWFGSVLLKQHRRSAPVIELILEAFEEQGWSPRIDDPLLQPKLGHFEISHLRNAVHALNRRLLNRMIQFGTDGRGKSITWRRVE